MVQRMLLLKEKLHERRIKFGARRDHALAIIVLSVEPTLIYLLGDPVDPVVVWKKLPKEDMGK